MALSTADENSLSRCNDCGTPSLICDSEKGDIICSTCGVVQDRIYDLGPEWRTFNKGEENSKIRAKIGKPNPIGITTFFTPIMGPSPDDRGLYDRLATIDQRSVKKEDRRLLKGSKAIRRITSRLNIPESITNESITIYRKALKADLVKNRTVEGMATAAIFITCKKGDFGLVLKDLLAAPSINAKEIRRCIRTLHMHLKVSVGSRDLSILVSRLGQELALTVYTQSQACDLVKEVQDRRLNMGKNPMTIAAACLYLASIMTGERRTQIEVAQVAKTTPVTVRQRSDEIIKNLDLKIERKRGAGAKSVVVEDPSVFTRQEISQIA